MGRKRIRVDEENFQNAEAISRYRMFSWLPVRHEREVELSDFEDLGIPNMFRSRGWLSLVGPPQPSHDNIVREFYANMTTEFRRVNDFPESLDVYLRGKTINFSINRIAQLLNLPRPGVPEYHQLVDKLDLNEVKSSLVDFKKKRYPEMMLVSEVKMLYRVLNSIVAADIDPMNECDRCDDPVGKDGYELVAADKYALIDEGRARLLYMIGNNVPIDMAAYIFRVICCASVSHCFNIRVAFGSLITRLALDSGVRIDSTDTLHPPPPPINGTMFFSKGNASSLAPEPCPPQLVPPSVRHIMSLPTNHDPQLSCDVHAVPAQSGIPSASTLPFIVNPPVSAPAPAPAPASEPSPPQLNQPPPGFPAQNMGHMKHFEQCSTEVRKGLAPLTTEVAKLSGGVHASGIPYPSTQPSAGILEPHEDSNDSLIPSPNACANPSTSTGDLETLKQEKEDQLAHAIGEVAKSLKEFSASQMKLKLGGEEVLGVVSKIPNLSRLQVFKAVRIILGANPEEFSILKSLPDFEKTKWVLLLISQLEGKFLDQSLADGSDPTPAMRPQGRKPAKASKKQSPNLSAALLETVVKNAAIRMEESRIREKVIVTERELAEEKKARKQQNEDRVIDNALNQKLAEEKKARQQQNVDRAIMAMDTSHMTPNSKLYWAKQRQDIMSRRRLLREAESSSSAINRLV